MNSQPAVASACADECIYRVTQLSSCRISSAQADGDGWLRIHSPFYKFN